MSQQHLLGTGALLAKLNMKKIYEEEEDDNFIFSLREEIVKHALEEIDKSIQEKHAYEMVADCAIEAFKKVVAFHFYYHMDPVDISHSNWSKDEPVAPSPADNWAAGMTSIKQVPTPTRVVSYEVLPRGESTCKCDLGVDCLCLIAPDERIQEQIDELYKETKLKSVVKSITSSTLSTERVTSDTFSEIIQETAVMTPEVETLINALTDSQKSVKIEKHPPTLGYPTKLKSEISLKFEDFTLPPIEVPSPIDSKSPSAVVGLELPPIRIDATFQCIPLENPPKKKIVKKRKKDKKFIIN